MRRAQHRSFIQACESLERRCLLAAIAINGVQPLALQIPQLDAILRRTPAGTPLGDPFGDFSAVFDTASPGLSLNSDLSDAFGVTREQAGGGDAVFTHDHAQGSINNNISELLYVGLADPQNPGSYINGANPKYLELGAPLINAQLADQNVFGPEAVAGNVVVINPTPANHFGDPVETYVYPPGTPFIDDIGNPGIPTVAEHIKLSYGDYSRFTTNVSGATSVPNLHKLVFVGNNPVEPDPTSPAVGFGFNGGSGSGAFLLATGSNTSMISLSKAASLGVTYQAGTFGTNSAALNLPAGKQQFRMTVQSAAGPVTLAGFYLDTLTLQTTEGDSIVFNNAPVLVGDLSLGALASPNHVILDGTLGMNLFSASAVPTSGQTVDQQTQNQFNWIVYDESAKTLGLDPFVVGQRPQVQSATFNQGTSAPSLTFTFSVSSNDHLINAETDPNFFSLVNQADGQSVNTTIQVSGEPAAHTVTYTFSDFPHGLPDGNYTFTLNNGAVHDVNAIDPSKDSLGRDYTLAFFSDQADANHDRAVNALDFNALASNFGGVNRGFSNGDFNTDGVVNSTDFNILAARFDQLFAGPNGPAVYFSPGESSPPSGAAAPAPPLASLFGRAQIDSEALLEDVVKVL